MKIVNIISQYYPILAVYLPFRLYPWPFAALISDSLIEPRTNKPGDDPKYSVTLLIPKTDFATKADIDTSIQAAAQDAVSKVGNGAAPPQLRVPM